MCDFCAARAFQAHNPEKSAGGSTRDYAIVGGQSNRLAAFREYLNTNLHYASESSFCIIIVLMKKH